MSEETTVPTENSDVAAGEVSTENKEDTNNIKNIEISKMVDFRLG